MEVINLKDTYIRGLSKNSEKYTTNSSTVHNVDCRTQTVLLYRG